MPNSYHESVARQADRPLDLGGVPIPNRVVLAPLAGIGNWFVRLQAKRHGAGLVVSEMVSSFAVHHATNAPAASCCASIPTSTRCRCSCSVTTPT